MKLFLNDIKDYDTEFLFSGETPWVEETLISLDENYDQPLGKHHFKALTPMVACPNPERPTQLQLAVRRLDAVVVMTGKLTTQIRLNCSRCATAFWLPCVTQFSNLFCQDPSMAGVGHLGCDASQKSHELKPMGQNHGYARHAHDFREQPPTTEATGDLDITYLADDFIDLSAVLAEQAQLQVPFQPLCQEECRGMCAQCGADLNLGRCACAALQRFSPFTELQNQFGVGSDRTGSRGGT